MWTIVCTSVDVIWCLRSSTCLWFVVVGTELANSIASYAQFVVWHDEGDAKGVGVAKDLCVCGVCKINLREVTYS